MGLKGKQFIGLIILFTVITAATFLLKKQLANIHADYKVVLGANALLFLLGVISLLLHTSASAKPNPQVFIRSVMLATILKLVGVAAAVLIYVSIVGKAASTNAVIIGLVLYLLYTWIEKKATLQISKSKNS